ncbi:MAG: apolipoprotein N-acyltransferase [Saprospiraceae bacterium]|nr:apolipoprotein N-acyltransferase [Saprospiraceae bacterium]
MNQRYFTLASLVLLVIAVVSAWRMFQLPLWGYLPLFLFISVWLLMAELWLKRKKKYNIKAIRWLGLGTISAVLLSLGFPPFPSTFTMLLGFVPLLWIEKEIRADETQKKQGRAIAWYAYYTFVLWNILVTFWVTNTALIAGVVAIFINSLFMLVPFMLFSTFRKIVGDRTAYFTFIAFWISFEYGHMSWELTWPWLTLGNSLSQYAWLPQWYSYTGVFGGSLWILLSNIYIFEILKRRQASGLWHIPRILGLSLFVLIPLTVSLSMYFTYEQVGESVEVVVVQPNYEPHYEKFTVPGHLQADRFVRLSEDGLTQNTKYLVFPETAFDYIHLDKWKTHVEVQKMDSLLASYPNLNWVTGLSAFNTFDTKIPGKKNLRPIERDGVAFFWESYNCAVQQSPGESDLQIYFKSRLVPGPEIFPYQEYLFFLKPLIEKLEGTLYGLGTQEDRGVFIAGKDTIAPVICYESIFGEYVNDYINNGANAIFIMTNDGWWDDTPGYIQHLKIGALRAIETRRDIARSANTGVSCYINQRGDIRLPTKYETEAVLRDNVSMNSTKTFYVKWGDYIGRLACFIAIFQILYIIFGIIKKRLKIH